MHQTSTPERPQALPARRQGVAAIETGARLLAVLADAGTAMMLRDLAGQADMAPAKAHRYLVSLIRSGLVQQHRDTGQYDIGALALRLGLAGLNRIDALANARERLPELRDTLAHSVAIALWSESRVLIVHWLDSNAPVSARMRTGSSMPLTRSASGRAFAAFDRRDAVQARLRIELAENRRAGIEPASARTLAPILATTQRHGMARVSGDLVEGIDSLAVPIFAGDGHLALVVTALGHSASFDARWQGPVAQHMRSWAAQLSRSIGASKPAGQRG